MAPKAKHASGRSFQVIVAPVLMLCLFMSCHNNRPTANEHGQDDVLKEKINALQHEPLGPIELGNASAARTGNTEYIVARKIELFRFYVDRNWHGKGIAKPMMNECVGIARGLGGKTICLSVWLENPRAIRFYEKTGFRKEGTQPYVLGNDLQTDWVMAMDIGQKPNGN